MQTYKYKIEGLDCAACANELEDRLKKIGDISNVSISFITEKLTFSCQEDHKSEVLKQIKKIIKKEAPDVSIEEV